MALLVLGYPTFDAADYRWLQAFRADHDPQFRIVAPHVTLVFPVDEIAEDELVAHVRGQAKVAPKLSLALASALPMPDAATGGAHLFLVPDAGFSALVKLHDRLYTELLAPHLRLDLPFVPHLTIGWKAQPAEAQRLAAELNAQDFTLQGEIARLTVARFAGGLVTNLVELPLRGTG